MRTLLTRLLVVTFLVLAPAGVGVATAQTPFDTLPPVQQDPSAEQTTGTASRPEDDGLERWQQVLIFMAGVALIAGIGFAIVADARKNAPVTEEEQRGAHRSSGQAARKAQSKDKQRKKAKAARAARKQNR